MTIQSKEVAVELKKSRDHEQIREQLISYRESVFLLCLGFARNTADAQDLTQETYAKALYRLPSHGDDHHMKFWLLRIARNTCLDQERRKRVRRFFMPWLAMDPADQGIPENTVGNREEIAMVKRAISKLPRQQREVLVLREYNELSYKEIAQILQINEGTVMSRLNRSRQAVIRYVKEELHGKKR